MQRRGEGRRMQWMIRAQTAPVLYYVGIGPQIQNEEEKDTVGYVVGHKISLKSKSRVHTTWARTSI
jgi:hypothetical protein